METKEFKRKDGTTGITYRMQPKDICIARFDKPLTNEKGKYKNYAIGVTYDKKEITIQLTATQCKALERDIPLTGKVLEGYEYNNKYGKQTGIKVLK